MTTRSGFRGEGGQLVKILIGSIGRGEGEGCCDFASAESDGTPQLELPQRSEPPSGVALGV